MEKVNVIEVNAYAWDCPKCGYYNCQDKYSDLICDGCAEEFEVGEIEK